MAKRKEKKKPIFEKVGIVFRNPVRADIMRQIADKPQKPTKIAETIGIQKQSLNYHLNALKKGGLIKSHTEELPVDKIPKERGIRINGVGEEGKIQVTYGVELTENGKNVVNQYIDPLYEVESGEKDENIKINKKEDE